MKMIWIVAGVALATGSVAVAEENQGEGNDTAQSEKVICKTKKVTGSRTKVNRTCMTRAQWDAQAAAARDLNNKLSRDASMNQGNGSAD